MAEHAEHSLSGMYRWCKDACPGSISLCRGKPNLSGPAAREGSRAHKVLESIASTRFSHLLTVDHPDIKLRAESAAGVDYALKTLDMLYRNCGMIPLSLELRVAVSKAVWGTCDILGYSPALKRLYIIDYKNGVMPVNITDNMQLQGYGWGGFLYTQAGPKLDVDSVEMIIIQPNSKDGKYVKSQVKSLAELYDFSVYVEESVEETLKPNAPRRTGHWCYWCIGQDDCPEYKQQQEERQLSNIDDETTEAMKQYQKLINRKHKP